MKFDAIVGNPPYQIKDGGAGASSRPIYPYFVDMAKKMDGTYVSIIMPTRWFTGGKGKDLSLFRKDMLDDSHIEILHDYLNPAEVFPGTNIRGGICYFLRNTKYNNEKNLVSVYTHEENQRVNVVKRALRVEGFDIFIRDLKSLGIIKKVERENGVSLSRYVSSRKPFGLDGNITRTTHYKSTPTSLENAIICYRKGKKIGYIERDLVSMRSEWIDKWKVYTPRANNIGTELNDDNLNTFIGEPGTVCTEAYIAVGAELELSKDSAMNLMLYFKTKFARFLHSLAKSSHDASLKTYRFVPLQDFTNNSDIDWSKSISEIDVQLYAKYNLTNEEISFIESKIKPME